MPITFINSFAPSVTETMVSAAAETALFSVCFEAALRVPSTMNLMFPATRISVISDSMGASFFIFSKNLSATSVGIAVCVSVVAYARFSAAVIASGLP